MDTYLADRVLPTSATEPQVIAACDTFYRKLVRLDAGVEGILQTAEAFPDEHTLHIACAYMWLFAQTPEGQAQAGKYLASAQVHLSRLNERERAWVAAMQLWHERSFEASAEAFEELSLRWPQDMPAVKAVEFLYYILGQHASGSRFLAHMDRLAAFHPGDPDFLAVHAFAHELCGHMGPARDLAEQALTLAPINPWAQHALEHVLLWEGSDDEAIRLMEGWLSSWDQSGRIIQCHNAWHVALTHLDRLSVDRAFRVYDDYVWGKSPYFVVEQLDAIAFLWRAEMADIPVDPARYREIVPHIAPLAETLFMPFVTAHYAYAFARAGEADALEHLLCKVEERSSRDDAEARRVWAPIGRSIIQGVAALGRGEAGAAAEWLDPVMDRMPQIGGSDAQDDLFRFAHWDSLRKAGRLADARGHLSRRLAQKPASPLEERLLVSLG